MGFEMIVVYFDRKHLIQAIQDGMSISVECLKWRLFISWKGQSKLINTLIELYLFEEKVYVKYMNNNICIKYFIIFLMKNLMAACFKIMLCI